MTEEQLNKQMEQQELKASADMPSENKRRRLIKCAVALPVIMTLHSGAALARSSNLVGAVTRKSEAAKIDKNIICVRPGINTEFDLTSEPADIGDTPFATYDSSLTKIKIDKNTGLPVIDPSTGQPKIVPDKAAQRDACHAKPGIMVSATAWTSIMTITGLPNDTTL